MKLSSATAKKMASKRRKILEELSSLTRIIIQNGKLSKKNGYIYIITKSLSTESRQRQLLTENLNGSAKHI